MLLAIDVGNTQTVVGLFDVGAHARGRPATAASALDAMPAGLVDSWRVTTVAERTAEEHLLELAQLLELSGVHLRGPGDVRRADIDGVVVSSSVPRVGATLAEMAERFLAVPLVVVGPGIRTGMPIRYENPREVGADRVTNAVAALDLTRPPLVVVDLGTATTFDVISSSGEYLGGAIAPGLDISMDALYAHAAALPRVALGEPRRVIGRTTVESMQAGAVYGHAALVDGMCARLEEELGPLTVLATGGLAALVAPHARRVTRLEPWLTLHGLRLLYTMNAPHDGAGERRGDDW
jgi:type III pantothenate kinase